jgi:hypothetical protein
MALTLLVRPLARVVLCSLSESFGASPDSLPADRRPPPPQRARSGATSEHLRPAGQRPARASRRLSRGPLAPERTLNVPHCRRWGKMHVLSGAEAARRRHRRLDCRRPPVPTAPLLILRRGSAKLELNPPNRRTIKAREVQFELPLRVCYSTSTRRPAPPRHGAHAAHVPRPTKRGFAAFGALRRCLVRHPKGSARSGLMCALPLAVYPLCVPNASDDLSRHISLKAYSASYFHRAYVRC